MVILKLGRKTPWTKNDLESKQDTQSEFEAQSRAIRALIAETETVLARIDENMKRPSSPE